VETGPKTFAEAFAAVKPGGAICVNAGPEGDEFVVLDEGWVNRVRPPFSEPEPRLIDGANVR
jgi:hypothetical protein